ncbi:hypothetical protein [Paenibacillus humicola]|uniref:hypothetical protein n=1 Tax=Paenibacillus humicola TaxID=3110540 RepID=UPI00237A921F|nr:hypothetical protein [Paenibacillus humicola]
MNVAQSDHFILLKELRPGTGADAEAFRLGEGMRSEGFAAVRRFLDDFRGYLREFDETECGQAAELLRLGRLVLPEPGRISPSWTYIWQEFDGIIRTKRYLFGSIPERGRVGEWQVLLDNPFSNQNIAVYPGLTFLEAAYMFAYFRTDLTNNEYIRLQKVDTVVTFTGADRDGLDS